MSSDEKQTKAEFNIQRLRSGGLITNFFSLPPANTACIIADDPGGFGPQKDLYLNKCDLCNEVRSFLVQNDYLGSKELNPAEFYSKS